MSEQEIAERIADLLAPLPPRQWDRIMDQLEALLARMEAEEGGQEPGPSWTFDAATGQIRDHHGWALATVPHAIAGDESDLAHGRLMAAAPDLAARVTRLCKSLWEAAEACGDPQAAGRWRFEAVEAWGLLSDLRARRVDV